MRTPLGVNFKTNAPADWVAFTGISLQAGDVLVLGGSSTGAVNNATWNGQPFSIGRCVRFQFGISDC